MLAYFDCFSGISGDMTLGSLVDLGVPVSYLEEQLSRIPLTGFSISVTSVHRSGIHARRVSVDVSDNKTHRNFAEIRSMIASSALPEEVKATSLKVFERLAEAEGRIHNCLPEEVHFHEVGGVDAIVDIVGMALCLKYLDITDVIASRIPLGKGFVECRHGTLPIPAPATLAILKGIPVYGTDIPHELVTPTGAAIITSLAQSFCPMPRMVIQRIGYGAGLRKFENQPNLLRVILGTTSENRNEISEDRILILECCIDDMNPEVFGFLMDRLLEEGALDVYWIPVYMKKNRPGTMLQVLCKDEYRETLIYRIFSETTSLGIRFYETNRRLLWRHRLNVNTSYGTVAVKGVKDPQGKMRIVPEYEECKRIAVANKVPLRVVYETIVREAGEIE
ncbi:MAG: nickel pincer cofactor biosynthesis protein LarC [Desulfobacterales bacterium]|jgi:hypothetical protein